MNINQEFIYAPNIRLFTYHLKTVNLTNYQKFELKITDIETFYQNLLDYYGGLDQNQNPSKLKLRSDFSDFLNSGLPNLDLIYHPQGRGRQRITLANNSPYKGFIYPQFLNDTYSFSLTIYYPQNPGKDKVPFAELSQLKPPRQFFSGINHNSDQTLQKTQKKAFWGSTIILSGFLPEKPETPAELKPLADRYLQNFLNLENLEDAPPFYTSGELIDGYIYEYQNPNNYHPYGHIIILFIFAETTTEKLNKIQWDLPELFLYHHKNKQNFADSKKEYKTALEDIKKIEDIIQNFPVYLPTIEEEKLRIESAESRGILATSNSVEILHKTSLPISNSSTLSDQQLKNLKQQIKNLLDLSLKNSQYLRSLGNFQNTIDINRENYLNKINRLEKLTQSQLNIWQDYANLDFQRFQRQIQADLTYLHQGSLLLDRAIATIRGLVEIDQAERDQQRQKAEQLLQDNIQAIGLGVGTGAILASTFGLVTQPATWPWQKNHSLLPHPFPAAVVVSSLTALLVWQWTKNHLKKKRNLK
ncbi:MAG: hypothetical protein SWX82_21685 [Cyanobacteriota bacterium]|nr:hypothetical protein [Cyanobacteriota bacterium]